MLLYANMNNIKKFILLKHATVNEDLKKKKFLQFWVLLGSDEMINLVDCFCYCCNSSLNTIDNDDYARDFMVSNVNNAKGEEW